MDAFTVLDCIFSRETHTYIVMDIMCWAGYRLYDCKSEFRMYWLCSKLQELEQQGRCGERSFGFVPVPFHNCDSGIQAILSISRSTAWTSPTRLLSATASQLTLGSLQAAFKQHMLGLFLSGVTASFSSIGKVTMTLGRRPLPCSGRMGGHLGIS